MARKSSRPLLILLAIALLIAILLVAVIALKPLPRLIWNASKSVPIGMYWVEFRRPTLGEITVLKPPEWVQILADQRHYLPSSAWLLKPLSTTSGAIVCRYGTLVFIDGKLVAKALKYDKKHRPMPVWKGCQKLTDTQVFLLSRHRDSFDSRYFGPVDRSLIIGTAKRLF